MPKEVPTGTIQDRVQAVERLTELFRAERFVYLGFAVAAFLLLIVCVIAALVKDESTSSVLGAFGSSGVVTFTSARAIVMWNRALAVVAPTGTSSND
jgi:drug/metabolite transporter (DMT)-like permease